MRRRTFSWLPVLAAAVLLLLPLLAWLQFSWLNQIADADRERRQRTLDTAVLQLSHDLDVELSRAFFGLQIDPSVVEAQAWGAYRERFDAWAAGTTHADSVERIYLAESPLEPTRPGPPRLRAWNPDSDVFEDVEWPADLDAVKARLSPGGTRVEVRGPDRGRGERVPMPPLGLGDERTLVAPILRMRFAETREGTPINAPPDVTVLGYTIIRFDLERVMAGLLPDLVARHFTAADGTSEFRVAVVEREHRDRIVYESEPRAAGIAAAAPDAETGLLALRNNPMFFMRRGGRSERGPAPAPGASGAGAPPATETRVIVGVIEGDRRREGTFQTRVVASDHAHWQLVAQHRAGSLEAAVAAARRRSLALSSGVLGLLAVAIGLIVVSARRAARLAHQQVEFVAAVSHELRTPVSVIGAAAGNLADGIVADPARVKTYGQTIQNEARRLGETVERVLQLAGIMAGRSMPPDSLAPEALVDEALAACRHEIDAAGAEVVVDVPADLPPVAGDVVALRSAIQNLVSNAIKYGGDARWVRVSARATGQGPREMVEIAVEDRGLGIDADERRLIFDAFTRGRAATDRQIQGSGLGLNLVQRIAEAHGGSVSVSSEPGRGSTFTLRLPAARVAVREGAEDAALRPLGSSR